jgi:hypothetical protein
MEDTQTVGMGESKVPKPAKMSGTRLALIIIVIACIGGLVLLSVLSVTLNHQYEKRIAMMENGTWPGQNNTANLTQAYTTGIITTLIQVLNTTNDCQITSIKYGNQSRELVDVECVRRMLIEKNITV